MASRGHTKCRFHSRGGESAIAGNSVDEGEEQPGTTANCGCFFFVGGARWDGRGKNDRGRNVLRSEADWSCEAGDLGPQCGERRKAFSRDLARVGGGIDGQRTPCRGGGGPYVGTKRGSAIAGVACGLPVVAMEGWETAAPITEAGVELTKPGEQFGPALMRVLGDPAYRACLAERSRKAQQSYFSWQAIAQSYATALGKFERA